MTACDEIQTALALTWGTAFVCLPLLKPGLETTAKPAVKETCCEVIEEFALSCGEAAKKRWAIVATGTNIDITGEKIVDPTGNQLALKRDYKSIYFEAAIGYQIEWLNTLLGFLMNDVKTSVKKKAEKCMVFSNSFSEFIQHCLIV